MRRAHLKTLSDVAAEAVIWLWRPYVPIGKLTLLEGDPAAGKTWVALAVAAAVTRGIGLPGGQQDASANVLYLTAEDGLADTLRPRLDAVGADLARMTALVGIETQRSQVTLHDLDVLADALRRTHARLAIIDPIQGYLGARTDMYRANEVRPILSGLAALAEEHQCAMLCIRHLAKAVMSRALYRGLGSIDFTAAARSVLLVGADPATPDDRALVHIKCSLAPLGVALSFAIDERGFRWTGESAATAWALGRSDEDAAKVVEAAESFLARELAHGPQLQRDLERRAREHRIALRTLERAKVMLGVQSMRTADGWMWILPVPETREP